MDTNEGKEILTTAIIKKELLKLISYDFLLVTISWCAMELFFLSITLFFRYASFYSIANIIFTTIVLFCFIASITDRVCLFHQVSKERFTITKAILYKKEESKGARKHGSYKPPKLFFDRAGCYSVYTGTYYKWSHAYSMDYLELFETSRIDDHFTLVMLKKRILLIYNDKFFDTSSVQYSE